MESVTQPIRRRAGQLVVGDRISAQYLPHTFNRSAGKVLYVHPYEMPGRGGRWLFVAYQLDDNSCESTTYFPDAMLDVIPAPAPHPVAERPLVGEGGVWAVPVAGGLIEVDPPEGIVPASAPQDCHHECSTLGVSPDCGVHEHELRA